MELWFLYALVAVVFAGVGNFLMKVATKQNYSSELFILFGAVASIVVFVPAAVVWAGIEKLSGGLILFGIGSGIIASLGGIFRLYALHAIDTTIYFPLVKVLSPALAIVAGILIFGESFDQLEWIGLLAGVFVPVMLISKMEHQRQNNLVLGLLLVLATGFISALFSVLSKLSIDLFGTVLWFLTLSSIGVLLGSLFVILYKDSYHNLISSVRAKTTWPLFFWATSRGMFISGAFAATLMAYSHAGPLAIVHTIHSLYILIPIVLSIIFYGEHWNTRKIAAIILSVAALALLQ